MLRALLIGALLFQAGAPAVAGQEESSRPVPPASHTTPSNAGPRLPSLPRVVLPQGRTTQEPVAPESADDAHLIAFHAAGHLANVAGMNRQVQALRRSFLPRHGESLGVEVVAPEFFDGASSRLEETQESEAPKAPVPAPPSAPKKVENWFIAALAIAQIGIEALGAAMPAILQKSFGDYSIVADIAIVTSGASILGRFVGPAAIAKLGLKKAYLGALSLRVASVTAMALLMMHGHMSVPGLYLFYLANGFLSGVSITAESSVPPAVIGQDMGRLEKFGARKQMALEVVGTVGPIVTGPIVASMGFKPALASFPVTMGLAVTIMALTLKIPKRFSALQASAFAAPAKAKASFKDFMGRIGRGKDVVMKDPALRGSFWAYALIAMVGPFLYNVIAPAYGMRLAGAAHAELSASIYGMLTGLFSLGGIISGWILLSEGKRLKPLPENSPERAEALRRSMLRWTSWAAWTLAAFVTLAFPIPTLGQAVHLPGWLSWFGGATVPAGALILYGVAQVVALIKLVSFFQSRAPEKDVTAATAFLGAAALGVCTAGLVPLRFLFTGKLPFGWRPFHAFMGLPGYWPFIVFAALALPLALYTIVHRRRIDAASRPKA